LIDAVASLRSPFLLQNDVRVPHDRPQRRSHVVGYRVGKPFQLRILRNERRRPLVDAHFELADQKPRRHDVR
jgi:hypothetical protein